MKKLLLSLCVSLTALCSCSIVSPVDTPDVSLGDGYYYCGDIRVDQYSFQLMIDGEIPVDTIYCEDCGMYHIFFEGWEYDD